MSSSVAQVMTASALGRKIIANPGEFTRLVLLEAARFGMPGNLVAALDELAATLGLYDPLPPNQSAYLAAPLMQWRSHPDMPTHDRTPEIESLAMSQRAEVVFGATKGVMVGPAEIVVAMNNCITDEVPEGYRKVFDWASVRVCAELEGLTLADAATKLKCDLIPDDAVLKPRGQYYNTYVEIAQNLRRTTVAALHPTKTAKAIAAVTGLNLLEAIQIMQKKLTPGDNAEEAAHLEQLAATIERSIMSYQEFVRNQMAEEQAVPA